MGGRDCGEDREAGMTRAPAVRDGYAIQAVLERAKGSFPKDILIAAQQEFDSMRQRIVYLKSTNERLSNRLHGAWETNNFLQNERTK